MKCKNAICYVGSDHTTNLPISHSGRLPPIRVQEYAARKYAQKADTPIMKHFCDLGKNVDRLSAPSFMEMLNYLAIYRQAHNEACLVIIHSEICVARNNAEFIAVSKAIFDAGGFIAISSTVNETVQ